jgi:hypothetical protein
MGVNKTMTIGIPRSQTTLKEKKKGERMGKARRENRSKTDRKRKENQPPETRPSTFCIAEILIDQSFSGTRIEAIFSISRISSFSEYTLIGSIGFSVISPSAAKKLHSISQCH